MLMAVLLLHSCGPKNGLVKKNGNTYYYVNGEMRTGFQGIKDDTYYFYEREGEMAREKWIQDGMGNYFYFDGDGKMLKDGIYQLDDGNYYCFSSIGRMLHDTEIAVEGMKFSIDSKGVVTEAPYYSAPAPMGGVYNFYLKDIFPLTLPFDKYDLGYGEWFINEAPKIEVFGNSVTISGIVEHRRSSKMVHVNFNCRLSSIDENGVTDSVMVSARSAEIKGGEKTKFEINISKSLPLVGRDIYIEFIPDFY